MKSPVFIVGCDRSGTTLLRLMLNQSPILHIPQESRFLVALHKNQELYGDFTQSYQRWFFIRDLQTNQATSKTFTFPIFNLTLEEAEASLVKAAPTNFAGAAATIFTASALKCNKQRWGDKTPHQIQHLPFLAQAFPDAKFIHVIRDGRDVAVSIRNAGWRGGKILEIARYWKKQVEAGRSAGVLLGADRYFEVFYEQLIEQPETTLKSLCNWLEIEYTPQMLNYYVTAHDNIPKEHSNLFELTNKPLDTSRVYAWKRQLSHQEVADFESVTDELLNTLGYKLSGVRIPWWKQLLRETTKQLLLTLSKAKSKVKSNLNAIAQETVC
jgi:hypothetical protein